MRHSGLFSTIGALATCGAASAGGDLIVDDFEDGVLAPLWVGFQVGGPARSVHETNGRLELPSLASAGAASTAGALSSGWKISLLSDFQMRVGWHELATVVPEGDRAIGLALVGGFQGTPGDSAPSDAVEIWIGSDGDGAYIGFDLTIGGAPADDGYAERFDESGTIYVSYDAAADALGLSPTGFDDPLVTVPGFGAMSGADAVWVALDGTSAGTVPAIDGADSYLDDFVVVAGVVVVPTDLNSDGVIDVGDLILVITNWGRCAGVPCVGDIDGDGTVGVLDLVELLLVWS